MSDLTELTSRVKNGLRANQVYPVRTMSNVMNASRNEMDRAKQKSLETLTKNAQAIAEALFFEQAEKEQIDFSGDYDRVSTSVLPLPGTPNIKVTVGFEYLGIHGFGFIYLPILFDLHQHEAELALTSSKEQPEPTVVEVGNFYCPQTSCISKSVFDVLLSCVEKFGRLQYPEDIAQSLRRWFITKSQFSYGILQNTHGKYLTDRALKEGLQNLVDKGLLEYDEEEENYCLTNHKPAGDIEY